MQLELELLLPADCGRVCACGRRIEEHRPPKAVTCEKCLAYNHRRRCTRWHQITKANQLKLKRSVNNDTVLLTDLMRAQGSRLELLFTRKIKGVV